MHAQGGYLVSVATQSHMQLSHKQHALYILYLTVNLWQQNVTE